jgi:hypothetical protein
MATDIFGRESAGYGGAFSSSKATLTFTKSEANALLVTQAQLSYGQQLSRIFELQSDKAYFVVGRTQGRGSLGTVIGPKPVSTAFYKSIGDPCKPETLHFNFSSGSCSGGKASRIAHGVVVENLGFSVSAQDMLINEQVAFQFSMLSAG